MFGEDHGNLDLRFGACISGKLFVVDRFRQMFLFEPYHGGSYYNFYGYHWTGFTLGKKIMKTHEIFQSNVRYPDDLEHGTGKTPDKNRPHPPTPNYSPVPPNDVSLPGGGGGNSDAGSGIAQPTPTEYFKPEVGVGSVVINSIYTDQPPAYTDEPFTGMPEKSVTALVTFFYQKYLTPKYRNNFIIVGVLCLAFCCICFLCLAFLFLIGGRSHRHHRYYGTAQPEQAIKVIIKQPPPPPRRHYSTRR